MTKIKEFINKLSKPQKITCVILLLGFALLLSIGIPTLARYKNRSTIITVPVWDGSVANSYKSGSGLVNDPYIISNGSELAYFSSQLLENNYANKFFALSNDIKLNEGIFRYDTDNGIQYILDAQVYYVDSYSNKYYDNVERIGEEVGTVNVFNSLDGFKGNFDGGSYIIYGLYITSENNDEVALFTNLQGTTNDLYVENSIIYGGTVSGGIASITSDASLKNILFDGYVVGRSTQLTKEINIIPTAPVINIQNIEKTDYIDLTNNTPFIGSEIVSTSITGNYTINGPEGANPLIKINGVTVSNGSFEINLGTSILNNIPVSTSVDGEEVTLTFSNLSYNVVYNYAVSGGIVAISNNTIIENVINKADVYGYSVSGGLVGVTTNLLTINQSYNTGNIYSEYVSGGLVSTIEKCQDDIVISKSYNAGDMFAPDMGGLISIINNNLGSVAITNVFNTSTTNYSIGTIYNTTVNVSNAYFVNGSVAINTGTINGNFVITSINNLEDKSYVTDNLLFNEFVDYDDLEVNNQNVWVYEDGSLPILFIDDILNPLANIHVNVYSWNNLSYELSPVKLDSNITFSIEEADELVPIKEKYYYISNKFEALTKDEILQINSWNLYSDVVQIAEEGFYVIYAKIVDYDDKVTYINTDILVLDLTGSAVSISIDNNTWADLRPSLNYVYIDREKEVTVEAIDNLSGIASIKYYITDQILSTNDLDNLNDSSWSIYVDGILINEIGTYIVYIQVMDNCNYITYVNTDYIVLGGYTGKELTVGRNNSSYVGAVPYITNKSAITLNFSYTNTASYLEGHTHNLISNILLPMGTKVTLLDNINEKVYEYRVPTDEDIYNYNNSCDVEDLDCIKVATYPFTLFKEVGAGTPDKLFIENAYYDNGVVSEDFTIVVDLFSTNIIVNYNNVMLYMELHDSNGVNVRPTLYNTIEEFNVYSNINSNDASANLSLSTDYIGNEVMFNSDSVTNINLTSGLDYKYVDGFKIIDTTYEDKEIGLSIKLIDIDDNIVDKEYLKSIVFKLGDNEYYPEADNIVRINLESGIADVTKILTIITYKNNSDLEEGTYYFKISNYASIDGKYYDGLGNSELSIPVNITVDNPKTPYGFDVSMDDANRIISKINNEVKVMFNIFQGGYLYNPNIRVSLYKKEQLTAYNQNYSIVDLSDYVSNNLNLCESNVYYVSTSPMLYNDFELNLITANFENTGYKFVFDLYSGTRKMGTIEKYFIIK
ncbi:MAG: hypothetical protein PHS45_01130 [Bacilli bacterium]|nr:hypothetical protein [Bacilli bacterium]